MVEMLFLAANPLDTEGLRLDEEYREIGQRLSGSPFLLNARWAVRAQDLQQALFEVKPAIVHFSGHGDDGLILLEDPIGYPVAVPPEALAELFRIFADTVRCVVLNACESSAQARMLAKHISCAIGMEGPISVGAGRAFATSFYQGLAHGKDVATAFELGRNQILLEGLDEDEIPKLYFNQGVDRVFFTQLEVSETQRRLGPQQDWSHLASEISKVLGLSRAFTLATAEEINDDPPPTLEKCSTRSRTIGRIKSALAGRSWYAIHGSIGSGKTHLASLLAREYSGQTLWLRLRDCDSARAAIKIDRRFAQLRDRKPGQTRLTWFKECCEALGSDSAVVFDDLPSTSGRETLDDSLVFLATAAGACGVTLITTAGLAVAPPTKQAAGNRLLEEPVPPFDEDEIRELLVAHGAPEAFPWTKVISGTCRQHPVLIVEAARYLESQGWRTTAQVLDEILGGQYATNLDAPTQQDVIRTVPSPETRDFLYRLRVVSGSFSDAEAREVATLIPQIDRPSERLNTLLGIWIQRDGPDRYVTSPLVSRLKETNLDSETGRRVHQCFASQILRRGRVTPWSALLAIHHFLAADRPEEAGRLLLTVLSAYLNAKEPKDDGLLSELWSHIALPKQMPTILRICIRVNQIAVYKQQEKDLSFLLNDLERVLEEEELSPEFQSIVFLLGGAVGVATWDSRPVDAARFAVRSLRLFMRMPTRIGGLGTQRVRSQYHYLLWSTFVGIKTDNELRDWIQQIDQLEAPERSEWSASDFAATAAEIGCNELWLREYRKPLEQRNWESVLGTLALLRDWSLDRHILALHAWVQWCTIVVLAEYVDRFDEAIALGRRAISDCASDERAVFWLSDIVGRQFYYKGLWQESLSWFMRCVNSGANVGPAKRAWVTAYAGINAAYLKEAQAIQLLSQAADVATHNPKLVSRTLAASILAELALEYWRQHDKIAAYSAWSRAAVLLLSVKNVDDDWRIAIRSFGNFNGFLAHVASGQSPDQWHYAKPTPGSMLERPPGILALFDSAILFVLTLQLALFAEAVGLYNDALRWAGRTSLADFDRGMRSLVVLYRGSAHVVRRRFAKALAESLEAQERARKGRENSLERNEREIRFDEYVARVSITTLCFGLAQLRITDGVPASTRWIRKLVRQIKANDLGRTEEFWMEACEVLSDIGGDKHWEESYGVAKEWGSRGELHLDLMYRLVALIGAPPEHAFYLMMTSFARDLLSTFVDLQYHSIVVPFLRDYWRWMVGQYPAHFSAPERTRRQFEDALAIPGEIGLRQGLRVIAQSLSVRLTDKYRSYLSVS